MKNIRSLGVHTIGGVPAEVFHATAGDITGKDTGITEESVNKALNDAGYTTKEEMRDMGFTHPTTGKGTYFLSCSQTPDSQWREDSEWVFVKK